MATPHDQTPPPTLDPDSLCAFCLDEVQALQRMRPAFSPLNTDMLLWSLTVSLAHALETASRVFGAMGLFDPHRVVQLVATLLWTPTPARLYDLWRGWGIQHVDWREADILQVPIYFLLCQTNFFDGLREVALRGHGLYLPVFTGWAGLVAGPPQPDTVRRQRFLETMDATLWATVRRRLYRTGDACHKEDPSAIADAENEALLAAADREHRGRAWIVELLSRDGPITTDSGQSIEIPTIPELPVLGMERADGQGAVWRAAAKESAIKVLARIAPGIYGVLETALPDAAHAAQRAEHDRGAAKKRGGSGGRKAKKAGTAEHAAQHVPIGEPDNDSACLDPETLVDDRPNPQQEVEAHQEEAEAQEVAGRALRIGIDRWGQSGQRMLEALKAGKTDKEAAEAAGISAPALTKRLKTLKKVLER